jgi:HSP20 family protein
MSIQRWDPFREMTTLRDAMNSLMEDALVRPRAGMNALTGGMPLDLRENEQAYIVETTVPGAKPENVEISILGDTLRITAEVRDAGEHEGERWLIRERRFGRFERTLSLPSQVDAEGASAEFADGVLRITLPKTEAARPRQIQVRAGAPANAELNQGGTSGEEGGEAIQPTEIEVESNSQG